MLGDTQPNPEFPTGDIDAFLNDMNTPKQDMNISQESILNDAGITDTPPVGELDLELEIDSMTAGEISDMLIELVDIALPTGLAALAKGDVADYKALPDQKKTLKKATTRYIKSKNIDIPPGLLLLLLFVFIYGPKVPEALSARKQVKQENERQRIIDDQTREISSLKKQIAEMSKPQEVEQEKTK